MTEYDVTMRHEYNVWDEKQLTSTKVAVTADG